MINFLKISNKLKKGWLILGIGLWCSINFGEGIKLSIVPNVIEVPVNSTFSLNVNIEAVQDLAVVEIHLSFDPKFVEVIDADSNIAGIQVKLGSLFSTSTVYQNIVNNEQGKIDVTIEPSTKNILETKEIISIDFKGKENGKISLTFDLDNVNNRETILLNSNAERIAFIFQNGEITITEAGIQMGKIPTKTQLLGSYPNPFNPECWIPYELKDRGNVQVRIYNVLGQKIRELNLGQKQIGFYITKDKAVYWDGKDNKGKEVVSGVYYYELVVDGKVIGMKKNLVLK